MKQLKVFISQPMKDLTQDVIQAQRDEAIDNIKRNFSDREVVVLDSFFKDYVPDPNSNVAVKYLAKSIDLLADADLLVLVGKWSDARGCKIERTIAEEYGIQIFTY